MKRIIFTILTACIFANTIAQTSHSYSCDFESATENANWNLNTPKNEGYTWVNLWHISNGVSSLGAQSLYISADGGATAGYKKTESRVMIAWRELTLEAGRYDLSFDWMCGGDSSRAALMVAWIPESQFSAMVCKLNDDYNATAWIAQNMLQFNGTPLLTGGSVWTHTSVEGLQSDGTPHRLVYLFVNSSSAQLVQPGPCVDNILLARNNCGKPTDMEVSTMGQTAHLSWQSSGEAFNLRMHRMGDTEATEVRDLKGQGYTSVLPFGVYDIQIQVICQGGCKETNETGSITLSKSNIVSYLNKFKNY